MTKEGGGSEIESPKREYYYVPKELTNLRKVLASMGYQVNNGHITHVGIPDRTLGSTIHDSAIIVEFYGGEKGMEYALDLAEFAKKSSLLVRLEGRQEAEQVLKARKKPDDNLLRRLRAL